MVTGEYLQTCYSAKSVSDSHPDHTDESLLMREKQEHIVSVVCMEGFLISKMHACSWCMKD